jgi:hypothetical protein
VSTDTDYLVQADELRAAATRAAVKYGPRSQAVVFLKYEELIRLWFADATAAPAPQDRLAAAAEIRAAYARQPVVRRQHPTRVVGADPLVIEFDQATFDERYASTARTAIGQICHVTSADLPDGIATGAPHMFVVDDEGRLLVWRRRISSRELILGRAKSRIDDVAAVHPMLVPDRLRVRAAGEIVLIGTSRVHAIVANTKSGHYRPPPSTGEVVRKTCARLLAVPTDRIDVFTVGLSDEDCAASTHRLAGAGS